jgi:ABC-type antimicrobial peptide transport system permease subunit
MTFSSFFLILRRQFQQKWGRFLLASGGIIIGVWAITLTTGLSLGLQDTIVTAINSQASAKQISLYKTSTNQTDFFQISDAPKFVALGKTEIQKLKEADSNIEEIVPSSLLNLYMQTPTSNGSCFNRDKELQEQIAPSTIAVSSINQTSNVPNTIDPAQIAELQTKFTEDCPTLSITSDSFNNFYLTNKTNWKGSVEVPKRGEVAVCFKCGNLDFNKKFGVEKPEDLIGKQFNVEFSRVPTNYEVGKVVDVINTDRGNPKVGKQVAETLKIVSVIDDRKANTFSGGGTNFFIDYSYFTQAIKIDKPSLTDDQIGFIEGSVIVKSYDKVDSVIAKLKDSKYLPFSLTQTIVSGIKTAFSALTIVLAGFGFIALIASVFGIVNVMTISVLERQKEIGILKSLGARDTDIFSIFVLESASLGIIGWTIGILISLGMGSIIGTVFTSLVNNNAEWKTNLDGLGITSFGPSFPAWLVLGSLGLALFFTILSGVFPSFKASRQNPVEVLRSE